MRIAANATTAMDVEPLDVDAKYHDLTETNKIETSKIGVLVWMFVVNLSVTRLPAWQLWMRSLLVLKK